MDPVIYYVPVPVVCSGIIKQYIEEDGLYEVEIYDSPMESFQGEIYCKLIYSPGTDTNYFDGNHVKVLITFTFGGMEMNWQGVDTKADHYIIGLFNQNTLTSAKVQHPVSGNKDDYTWTHPITGGGMVTTYQGSTIISTGGSIRTIWKPFGHGSEENSNKTEAMNHHRIVSHNPPLYATREHFGMYTGKDDNDKASKPSPDDTYISYRRFVTQTKNIENWVSLCEGSWNPWVGPNNSQDKVQKGSGILYSRVINSGSNRITIEGGEEGDKFFSFRIDKIILGERQIPVIGGATPSISGNRFKFEVADDGSFKIFAGGKAVPAVNFNGFSMEVSKDGELKIKAAKKITFTHGDVDESINSLVLDPNGGVDITAMKGFRVNGKQLVTEAFIDFLIQNQAIWCQTAALGAPAPLSPGVMAGLNTKSNLPMITGGFRTKQVGPPASGVIVDKEGYHATVA